jgi:alpha-tubulin suppressor-like RCC1 family protein
LGNGTTNDNSTVPVQVSGLSGVISIACGGEGGAAPLALKSDGTVWVWGINEFGQLANGTEDEDAHPIPAQVNGVSGVVAIACGAGHSLAVKSDGTVWAWANNDAGQLGDGTTTNRYSPVQVTGLSGVVAIAGGGAYSLAVKSGGTVWAWGDNGYGQLGNGTTNDNSTVPVQVLYFP